MASILVGILILNFLSSVQCEYTYILCSTTQVEVARNSLTGYVYIGCWDQDCSVNVVIEKNMRTYKISPYEFEVLSTTTHDVADWIQSSVQISSTQRITVLGGTWDRKSEIYDIYIAYPVQTADVVFVVTISIETTFITVMTADTDCRFTFEYKYNGRYHSRNYNIKTGFVSVIIAKNVDEGTGALITSGRTPVAIYCADEVVEASLRSVNENGRFFLVTNPDQDLETIMTVYRHIGSQVKVTWVDQDGVSGHGMLYPHTNRTARKEVELSFKTLSVTSTADVSICMSYRATTKRSAQTALSLLVPIRKFTSAYVLSIPYKDVKKLPPSRRLILIAKGDDIDKILVNKVSVRRWLTTHPKSFKGKEDYSWAEIAHTETLIFSLMPVFAGSGIKYCVYMYGQSNSGLYYSEARGYSFYWPITTTAVLEPATTPGVITTATSTETSNDSIVDTTAYTYIGISKRPVNSPAEWMIFGVFLPLSFSLLVFDVWLLVRKKPIEIEEALVPTEAQPDDDTDLPPFQMIDTSRPTSTLIV